MLTASEKAQMRTDLAAVQADDSVSVVIRRGETSLAAQTVRIVRIFGSGRATATDGVEEARGSHLITGAHDLDIEPNDRLTVDGVLFRVLLVRPNRMALTEAEADMVE